MCFALPRVITLDRVWGWVQNRYGVYGTGLALGAMAHGRSHGFISCLSGTRCCVSESGL
jgi:hypothetical protein